MANNITNVFSYEVQFRYQSQSITFPEWISIFTICFAPLLAHIIAGAPKVIHLHPTKPPLHEILVHYSPMSIAWRYFAITDRRLRARSWTPVDLAAINALFWTSNGWDGSETMINKCNDISIQHPPPLLDRLVSKDGLKTLIVTLQAVQAIYLLTYSFPGYYHGGWDLQTIFMPLAFIGLLRLPAALWLTDEYVFMIQENHNPAPVDQPDPSHGETSDKTTASTTTKPIPAAARDAESSKHFRAATSPAGLLARAFYISFLLGSFALSVYRMFPKNRGPNVYTLTDFLVGYIYCIIVLTAVIILIVYSFQDRASITPTVIPCISAIWYKVYTSFITTMMLGLIVVAALETRRTPCGSYTSSPMSADGVICPKVVLVNSTMSA